MSTIMHGGYSLFYRKKEGNHAITFDFLYICKKHEQ